MFKEKNGVIIPNSQIYGNSNKNHMVIPLLFKPGHYDLLHNKIN